MEGFIRDAAKEISEIAARLGSLVEALRTLEDALTRFKEVLK